MFKQNGKAVKLKIQGKVFSYYSEASQFLGVSRQTVRRRCLSQKAYLMDWQILDKDETI